MRLPIRWAPRSIRFTTASSYYVLWNDQFYGDPIATQFAPAGHSKGLLAWNELGDGMVLQVSTPILAGIRQFANQPRKTDGNTLGCVLTTMTFW